MLRAKQVLRHRIVKPVLPEVNRSEALLEAFDTMQRLPSSALSQLGDGELAMTFWHA